MGFLVILVMFYGVFRVLLVVFGLGTFGVHTFGLAYDEPT